MSDALLSRFIRASCACMSSGFRCRGPSAAATPTQQHRHESTSRRHLKRLRSVPAAPSTNPAGTADRIVFNPPSSAPSVYHTPLKFLPPHDRRRELYAQMAQLSSASTATMPTGTPLYAGAYASAWLRPSHLAHASDTHAKPSSLPPPVRAPYTKKYHLTEADVARMRALRAADPARWTRDRLAAEFECSQFFVGLVAPAPEHAARKAAEIEDVKARWGRRKREAREDRASRKASWGRDA